MDRKYELTHNIIKVYGTLLYQIKALKDINEQDGVFGVKKGDLGGYIERDHNLSQEGKCWIHDKAIVMGSSRVEDNAVVTGSAKVVDSRISQDDLVVDSAYVSEYSTISGEVIICGQSRIEGYTTITGTAVVSGKTRVQGSMTQETSIDGDVLLRNVIVQEGSVIVGVEDSKKEAIDNG